VSEEQTMVDVAAFYNERARRNPSNPPTRRDVAAFAGVSLSTAQRWLEVLEARGLLCFPIRRRHRGQVRS
jgi:DNA-binding transcriptional regulator YhcF (GntR family)